MVIFYNNTHPSPGDNHQSTGERSKEHRAKQKWRRETHLVTYAPGFSILSLSSIQPNLCLPRTRPPFIPPSTPFCPCGTHPFFPHAQTISSALLADSLSIPALLSTSSFLTLSIRDTQHIQIK